MNSASRRATLVKRLRDPEPTVKCLLYAYRDYHDELMATATALQAKM